MRHRSVVAAVVVALCAATTFGQATLEVSDSLSHGTLGDADLSLDEAIQLANGDIGLGALSNAEKAFVTGVPGAGVPDLVLFSFQTFPGTITAQAELTELHAGNDRIEVLGHGYKVGDIVYDGAGAFGGIRLFSANCAVIGLEVVNCATHGIRVSAAGGGDASGCEIADCVVSTSGIGVLVEGSAAGGASVGTAVAPVRLDRCTLGNLSKLGADSRGILVSGGTGDDNQVRVVAEDCVVTQAGSGGLEVRGSDTDAAGTGERNLVDVTVKSSSFERNAFAQSGPGVRLTGASAAATQAADDQVHLRLDRTRVASFNGFAVLVESGAGRRASLDLEIVQGHFPKNKAGGVALHAKDGDDSSLSARLLVADITGVTGPGVQVLASGAGTGQSIELSAIGCWIRDGGKEGIHVRAEKDAAIDAFVSDCFLERNATQGLLLEPLSATGTLDLSVQRNTFRGNVDGVRVASGASSTFRLDLGGGALGSRGGNTFAGQSGCGVLNQTPVLVTAERNDWGHASGPSDCDANDSDGITDPTGSGDGVGEYTTWSPFVAHDQNPELVITGSFDPPNPITLLVEDGVTGSPYLLWAGLTFLDPPVDGAVGNHWYLGVPFVRVFVGTVGTPIGPFNPPPELAGLEVDLAAGVLQAGTFEMTNVFPLY